MVVLRNAGSYMLAASLSAASNISLTNINLQIKLSINYEDNSDNQF